MAMPLLVFKTLNPKKTIVTDKMLLVCRFFIFAPNVFRLNVEETVSVQVWKATQVELYLQDERRTKVISRVAKNLQASK